MDHESTASGGVERRRSLQKEVVAGRRTGPTGGVQVSSVGQPATGRSAGVAGSTEPDDRQTDTGDRFGSGEVSRSATPEDASRGRFTDGVGLRGDHRESGPVSVWQADR